MAKAAVQPGDRAMQSSIDVCSCSDELFMCAQGRIFCNQSSWVQDRLKCLPACQGCWVQLLMCWACDSAGICPAVC